MFYAYGNRETFKAMSAQTQIASTPRSTKREVTIAFKCNSWLVMYVHRKKGQRYSAAGFYAPDRTLEQVKDWVRAQPNLILAEPSMGIRCEITNHREGQKA